MDLIKASTEELVEELIRRGEGLTVNTPKGPIVAKVIPDDEYPGIALVYSEKGTGEPGVIMEYTPTGENAGNVQLRIYSKENPDDEPVDILRMS